MSDFDEALGDERAGNARTEEIVAFVTGICPHHRKDEITHELFTQIFDENMLVRNTHRACFFTRRLDFLTLTKVCSKGDHFQSALYLEPFGDDGSIQTTGVGEDDAFDIGHGGTLLLRARR